LCYAGILIFDENEGKQKQTPPRGNVFQEEPLFIDTISIYIVGLVRKYVKK
jgi:hypothetical protein